MVLCILLNITARILYSDIGYSIYNNAVNGTVGATGIQPNGLFIVGNNIFSDVNSNNFYPAVKSALINAGANPQHRIGTYDFNGQLRSTTKPTVGAYVSCFIQYNMHTTFMFFRNFRHQQILVVP